MEKHFTLRFWTEADLASLVKYANNWNVSKNPTDKFPFPYTEGDGKIFIDFASKEVGRIFAIEVDGEAAGGIGIHPQDDIHRRNAELGYWLAEPFWGKGIVSRAIAQVIAIAFTSLPVDRIFARPFGTNKASQRVLEKNKFRLEARFERVLVKGDAILDELVYAIRREDWQEQQA